MGCRYGLSGTCTSRDPWLERALADAALPLEISSKGRDQALGSDCVGGAARLVASGMVSFSISAQGSGGSLQLKAHSQEDRSRYGSGTWCRLGRSLIGDRDSPPLSPQWGREIAAFLVRLYGVETFEQGLCESRTRRIVLLKPSGLLRMVLNGTGHGTTRGAIHERSEESIGVTRQQHNVGRHIEVRGSGGDKRERSLILHVLLMVFVGQSIALLVLAFLGEPMYATAVVGGEIPVAQLLWRVSDYYFVAPASASGPQAEWGKTGSKPPPRLGDLGRQDEHATDPRLTVTTTA